MHSFSLFLPLFSLDAKPNNEKTKFTKFLDQLAETEDKTDSTNTQTNPNETITSVTIPSIEQEKSSVPAINVTDNIENSNVLVTSNVEAIASTGDATKTLEVSNNNTKTAIIDTTITVDRVPVSDLETNRKNAINSLSNDDVTPINLNASNAGENCVNDERDDKNAIVNNKSIQNDDGDEISKLDAALDNLNQQVVSLLEESNNSKTDKIESIDAPLDEALANLNSEVLGLLKESRKIQDELHKTSESSVVASGSGRVKGEHHPYFDYSLYRERSVSPPPHPKPTYRWEDIRREKQKVRFINTI